MSKEKHVRHISNEGPILAIDTDELFENNPLRDKKLSQRRLARERVLQLLFSHAINERDTDELFEELIKSDVYLEEQALEFARQLLIVHNLHLDAINVIITERLSNWDFSRVALVDKILIQIGILEDSDGSQDGGASTAVGRGRPGLAIARGQSPRAGPESTDMCPCF